MERLPEDTTLRVYMDAANEVMGFLEFTGEVSRGGQPIPCLDTQVWAGKASQDGKWFLEDGLKRETEEAPGMEPQECIGETIKYKFYRKPMRNRMTILYRSAQPEGMKVSTMSAEIRRRLKTTCEENSKATHEEIISEFMDDLSAKG